MLRPAIAATSVALFLIVAAWLAPSAAAAHQTPPVQLGIFGNINRIDVLTGQQTQVGHVIVGWGQDTFDQLWPILGHVPMLGFDTGRDGTEVITPRAIARGLGDAFLLEMSASARSLGRPVYIRPLAEMNGH
jgi:hypothetical protein